MKTKEILTWIMINVTATVLTTLIVHYLFQIFYQNKNTVTP